MTVFVLTTLILNIKFIRAIQINKMTSTEQNTFRAKYAPECKNIIDNSKPLFPKAICRNQLVQILSLVLLSFESHKYLNAYIHIRTYIHTSLQILTINKIN